MIGFFCEIASPSLLNKFEVMSIKPFQENYKAFIFDMDGTMVDNMMVHHRAWQKKLSELGMPLDLEEVTKKIHGVNEEILARLFGDSLSAEERLFHAEDKEAQYREIFKDKLGLIDGLDEFLNVAKSHNIRLAIGTAAPMENVDFVLDNLSIRELFEVVVDAEGVSKGKPDPEIYLTIMEKMGLEPGECLIFEDSPTGAEAAVLSGAKTIVVTTTHEPQEFAHLQVAGFIQNFNELRG